ncbi:AEC family transporter [Corynebacterium uropygiale]|uniref:AEC family transporter n=1 Tax=Corynebacterium uropygiale TaxID=1775911 RepID=A0A9X1QQP8_9CORY|nr:AEC family transporter [Corynebacterium uropygiale]MCF4007554.1 AEC family transporter [Corynebacterium uropygiale]
MASTLPLLIMVFLILAVGFTLSKAGVITPTLNVGMSTLLVQGVLPVTILASAGSPYDPSVAKGFFIVFGISIAYYILAPLLLLRVARRITLPDKSEGLFASLNVFGNVGFIGIPLAQQLYGSTGLIYAISLNIAWNLCMFSLMRIILSGEKSINAKGLFINTNMVATYIMMVFYFLQPYWRWHETTVAEVILKAFDAVGSMMTPLSLFIISFAIASMSFSELIRDKWAFIIPAIRLLAIPFLCIALFAVLPLPGDVERVVVFLLAMPCATLNVIFANTYRLNVKFVSTAVTASYLFMLISLPIVIAVSSAVLGPAGAG